METAVPSLFGCASESELKEHVRAQSLTSVRQRMNVRGVLREEGGGPREDTLQWQRWRRLMREYLLVPCVSAQVCATSPLTL